MLISDYLNVDRGVTALIGGGGKTTLLYTLAEELRPRGRVLLCTSTHIRTPSAYPPVFGDAEAIAAALRERGVVCAGSPAENGKLTAPAASFEELASLADYVLVEADGSRGLPMKAHAPHEPVIPANAGNVILVVGADGFGLPVSRACHRPERWAQLAGCGTDDLVTPAGEARVILAEGLGDRVYVNKTEAETSRIAAEKMARFLPCQVLCGSLYRRIYSCLH